MDSADGSKEEEKEDKKHLAVPENSDIVMMQSSSKPEARNDDQADVKVNDVIDDVNDDGNRGRTRAGPRGGEAAPSDDDGAGSRSPARAYSSITIPLSFTAIGAENRQREAEDSEDKDSPTTPLKARSSSAGKTSSKKPADGRRRRRGTLHLSQKQKDAVKRHAKNATKQFVIFLISHVGLTCLVVAYAIMGAFVFQKLEGSHEEKHERVAAASGQKGEAAGDASSSSSSPSSVVFKPQDMDVDQAFSDIRRQYVERLYKINEDLNVFHPEKWQMRATVELQSFQEELYKAFKDGRLENADNSTDSVAEQEWKWSFAGSLLYSVTVITTIGYGHLTPKTTLGRVVTMLYALVGIPMTLSCLSNIGSFMAHCFRILWKQIVCQPCRHRIRRRSLHLAAKRKAATAAYISNLAKQTSLAARGKAGSLPGSSSAAFVTRQDSEALSESPGLVHDKASLLGRVRQGSRAQLATGGKSPLPAGDNRCLLGFDHLATSVSSADLHAETNAPSKGDNSSPHRSGHQPQADQSCVPSDTDASTSQGFASTDQTDQPSAEDLSFAVSTDQHRTSTAEDQNGTSTDAMLTSPTDQDPTSTDRNDPLSNANIGQSAAPPEVGSEATGNSAGDMTEEGVPSHPDIKVEVKTVTLTSDHGDLDPKLVVVVETTQQQEEKTEGEESAPELPHPGKKKDHEVVRVPIVVCLVIVAAYLVLGSVLFSLWEDWSYFDSSYFCFITLSTIGFGDIVPGYDKNAWGNQAKRVSCTCYLLFGLALLAMCFELIQAECRHKFRSIARSFGLSVDKDEA